MTVTPPTSTPMIGRAADVSAGVSPGTGFGDLLSAFGTQPANGGLDAGIPTPPVADPNAAAPGNPLANTDAELPVVAEPADTPVLDVTDTTAPAVPSAVNGNGQIGRAHV